MRLTIDIQIRWPAGKPCLPEVLVPPPAEAVPPDVADAAWRAAEQALADDLQEAEARYVGHGCEQRRRRERAEALARYERTAAGLPGPF